MAQEIEVTIEGGKASVNLKGFKGKSCHDIQKAFSAIGKETKHETKPEYYQKESTCIRQGK